jgi:6-phosphogluconolactonase
MRKNRIKNHFFTDQKSFLSSILSAIDELARTSIKNKGAFRIIISGGTSLLDILKNLPSLQQEWACWSIFWADERCLPMGHAARNDELAIKHWLSHIEIPDKQIHRMPAHLGPIHGSRDYLFNASLLKKGVDLSLLGIGVDGHIASLFPINMQNNIANSEDVISIENSPKPPRDRISLNYHCLCRSTNVIFIAKHSEKKRAIDLLLEGNQSIPASHVVGLESTHLYSY